MQFPVPIECGTILRCKVHVSVAQFAQHLAHNVEHCTVGCHQLGLWTILMIYSIPIETKLAAAIIEKAVTLVDNIPKCIEITRQGVIEFILLDTPR